MKNYYIFASLFVAALTVGLFLILKSHLFINFNASHFDEAFLFVCKNEGGYSDDEDDLGGETFMGISKASHPHLDVKSLTLEKVKEIYKKEYWDKSFVQQIKSRELAIHLFDWSVLCGTEQVGVIFQRALNATGQRIFIDGEVGKQSLDAYKKINNKEGFLWVLRAEMVNFFNLLCQKNPSQKKYLKGWISRVFRKI